jgi:hypothetical protein
MGMKRPTKKKTARQKSLAKAVRSKLRRMYSKRPGNWMDGSGGESKTLPFATSLPLSSPVTRYDPDAEFAKILSTPVNNPVLAFNEALSKGEVRVAEAWLYEGQVNERGRLMPKSILKESGRLIPYRLRYLTGTKFAEAIKQAGHVWQDLAQRSERLREAKRRHMAAVESLKGEGLLEESFDTSQIENTYDANQYSEYTPLYGGPFNKQLYLYDYLTMHARAYEAKNHNPIAKRIIDVLAQYAFGRRFKVRIKNQRKKRAWEEFDREHKIIHKVAEFWAKEYLTYGELMLDKESWNSIDPSSVWDIITDPDNISDVYYYYQSYATAFQTFTGYAVKGARGSKDAAPMEYIIRQLPAQQVLHIKGNCVSQEKRGRSVLFPILGWLKRIKDLYNAEVMRAQLQASFVWDDTIDGSASDIAAHAAAYAAMPTPASVFVHNKAVERKAMPALPNEGRSGQGISDELLAFIATAIGIPKEFFNVIASGGGNRATALVSAEPFEKVIEDLQAKFENLLTMIAEDVLVEAGLGFEPGDVEFTFPSVTKDTTTEAVANIMKGETQGYISHQTAAELFATEMNITTYDYDEEREKIDEDKANGLDPLMPPPGRFGNPNAPQPGMAGNDGVVSQDANPTKGQAKVNLKKQMNRV